MGVLGWVCGARRGRELKNLVSSSAEEEGKGIDSRGTRRSEDIVTGRQKWEGIETKALKASCSSEETGERGRWLNLLAFEFSLGRVNDEI